MRRQSNKQRRNRGVRRPQRNGKLVGGPRGPGYSQIIKVSGNVTWAVSTTGGTFAGVQLSGPGSGTSFTPNSSGTNYATLSQWGDFRLSKIDLTFIAQVGSAGDPIQVVSALDSTGNDLTGGTVTGAFNTILSRQSAKKSVVTPMQQRPVKHTWKPVEMQNRLWQPQASLASLSYVDAVQQWGVLFSAICPASSTNVSVYIDWYVEVREPSLSGVLVGKATPETVERLERLVRASLPVSSRPLLAKTLPVLDSPEVTSLRKEIADARRQLEAVSFKH